MKIYLYIFIFITCLSGCYVSENMEFADPRAGKLIKSLCGNYKINKVVWIYKNGTQETALCNNSRLDLYYSYKDPDRAYFLFNWSIDSYIQGNTTKKTKNDKVTIPASYLFASATASGPEALLLENFYMMPTFIIENPNNINSFRGDFLKLSKPNSKELLITGSTLNDNSFQISASPL